MRTAYRLRIAALMLLSLCIILLPQHAHASVVTTTLCNDASHDSNFVNNRTAYQQQALKTATTVGNLFPVMPALSQCVTNIMNVFKMLPNLADPLNVAQTIINPIIMGVISQVCSDVMGVITSVQTALTNIAKICLPIPQFNLNLDLGISAPTCSGGTSVSLITGFAPAQTIPSSSQFMGH